MIPSYTYLSNQKTELVSWKVYKDLEKIYKYSNNTFVWINSSKSKVLFSKVGKKSNIMKYSNNVIYKLSDTNIPIFEQARNTYFVMDNFVRYKLHLNKQI